MATQTPVHQIAWSRIRAVRIHVKEDADAWKTVGLELGVE
jgi:hypothetical protein